MFNRINNLNHEIMDIEKIKQNSNWDPSRGSYSGKDASRERRFYKRKRISKFLLITLYTLILIIVIFILYKKFK